MEPDDTEEIREHLRAAFALAMRLAAPLWPDELGVLALRVWSEQLAFLSDDEARAFHARILDRGETG